MPLTPAEMDFMTNHVYELHNFDRPTPAHEAFRSLDPQHQIEWEKLHLFQYLWQEQVRWEGPDDLFFFWVEPASRSSFILPWPTLEAFDARYLELYAEMILIQFEQNSHPLRFPRFVTHRTGRFSSPPIPVFTPQENEFLDAYYDEIRSRTNGPCFTAVGELKIPHDEINHLVGYRATELFHEGRPWPQSHALDPPIPWSSGESFKLRFFPPKPNYPPLHYVTLDRPDFSAKEHGFLAHYLHEMTTLTSGPAHEYLRSQSLSPILMIPFQYGIKRGASGLVSEYLTKPLPAFEIPWGTKSVCFGRVLRVCETDAMKKLIEPFLPPEESAYIYKPIPYPFLPQSRGGGLCSVVPGRNHRRHRGLDARDSMALGQRHLSQYLGSLSACFPPARRLSLRL